MLPRGRLMTSKAQETAATLCPTCHARTLPDPVVYSVVACYTCEQCGTEWSARLRNGRPDLHLYPASVARIADITVVPLSESPRPRQDADPRRGDDPMTAHPSYERMR